MFCWDYKLLLTRLYKYPPSSHLFKPEAKVPPFLCPSLYLYSAVSSPRSLDCPFFNHHPLLPSSCRRFLSSPQPPPLGLFRACFPFGHFKSKLERSQLERTFRKKSQSCPFLYKIPHSFQNEPWFSIQGHS